MMGKGLAFGFVLLLAGLTCLAQAQSPFSSFPPGVFSNKAALDPAAGGGGCSPGTNASNFIARRSGTADPSSAFCTLINGLDSNSLFTKFDAFYIFDTDTSGNALLSLINATYNGTANGSPTFSANNGYTGTALSTTVYIDTGFNVVTAPSPKFTQNSAHLSCWSFTNVASLSDAGTCTGITNGAVVSRIQSHFSDNNAYFGITGSQFSTGTNTNSSGFYIANRSGSTAAQAYKNGSSLGTDAGTSASLPTLAIPILASRDAGIGINAGTPMQISVVTFGSSLSSTDVTNLYNLLCTYHTTIHGSC